MKKRFAKILTLIMALLMLAGCGSNNVPAADPNEGTTAAVPVEDTGEEKVVTVATTSAWEALNPFFTNHDTQIAYMYPIYDSWFDVTADGEIIPRLFESWELSENNQVMTAHIRKDSYWSDGTPVTAHDVVWTYKTYANPNLTLSTSRMSAKIAGTDDNLGVWTNEEDFGMKALDDYTVEIRFKEDGGTTELNHCYGFRYTFVLPKHLLEDIPVESLMSDEFWEHPVTSGPFRLDSIISGERIEYVANEDYYLGAPDFDRLIVRVVPSNQILSGLMAGEIDITNVGSCMAMSDYEMAKNDPKFVSYEAPGFGNTHLLLNNEVLDQNMRKALDCAIDKQSIVDGVLYGYARVAISSIVPENPYRLEGIEGNAYDVERAKQLLAESEYDVSRPLRLLVGTTNSTGQNISVLLQQMFGELGLTVNIETYDMATISSKLFAGEFDIALMSSASTPFEPSECAFYFMTVPYGWNRLTDPSWVALFESDKNLITTEERRVIYDELQRRLVDEVPMIYLYHSDVLFINSQRISGMVYEDFALRSWRYWEWDVQ